MAQVNEQYVYGTAARKLEYDVYEENKILKSKKQARSNNKTRIKVVLLVAALFAACFMLMYRYALITELNYRISSTYTQYNNLKNDNSRLSVEVGKEMNLAKVKEIAESRLGMQKPDKYQIVHIRVPKTDYTTVAEKYEDSPKQPDKGLAALFDKVKKYAQLLY